MFPSDEQILASSFAVIRKVNLIAINIYLKFMNLFNYFWREHSVESRPRDEKNSETNSCRLLPFLIKNKFFFNLASYLISDNETSRFSSNQLNQPTKMAPNILDPVAKKDVDEENIVRSRSMKEKELVDSNHSQGDDVSHNSSKDEVFKPQIRWPDLIAQLFIHVGSLYGLYYLITLKAKLYTYIWCEFFSRKLYDTITITISDKFQLSCWFTPQELESPQVRELLA